MLTATYSPEDNKLRLYADSRLPRDLYDRVKAAGFIRAPKQALFVAPAWTPAREDLLLELCGEIGDEDTSLVERAAERADRFEDYSDKRAQDAEGARAAVERIADGIPLGQPILVGHHSERHARRDAERIENGMRKAVKMWQTSQYWTDRARGAMRHAKYKELPAVRFRRIKGLEADVRRCRAAFTPADNPPHVMRQTETDGTPYEVVWCGQGRGGSWVRVTALPSIEAHYSRWIAHYENRLAYERAMLGEQGGIAAERHDIQLGGQVLIRGEWLTVVRVNRKDGQPVSVSTNARFCRVQGIERIKDYSPPTADLAEKVKAATKLPPLCNYPGAGFQPITQAQWDAKHKDYKGSRVVEANEKAGRHRVRSGFFSPKGGCNSVLVFITDAKRTDPPRLSAEAKPVRLAELPAAKVLGPVRPVHQPQQRTLFDDMADSLKAGVKVVAAPQLFPTPADLAARVVELAEIEPGQDVLEPSAGTGNILAACFHLNGDGFTGTPAGGRTVAVEINAALAEHLRQEYPLADVRCADFLACNGELGTFDRIVMNPPFANGADIRHIEHARGKLKPGGRLVAICANGPRQREKLQPLATAWIDLPAGSFAEHGTNVNAAIVVIDA